MTLVSDDPATLGLAYQLTRGVVTDVRLEQVPLSKVNQIAPTSPVKKLNVLPIPEGSAAVERQFGT